MYIYLYKIIIILNFLLFHQFITIYQYTVTECHSCREEFVNVP